MERIFNFIKDIIVFGIILVIIYYLFGNLNSILEVNYDYNYDVNSNVASNSDSETKERKEIRNYIDKVFNPYYALLDMNEKEIYYDMLEAVNIYQDEVIIDGKITTDNLKKIYYSVIYDHPELFWAKSNYEYYTFDGSDDVYSIKFKYMENMDNIESMKQEFNLIVDNIVNEASKYESDIDKEKYVHDTLAKMITYDENMVSDQSAYGALIEKRAVCTGYAKAFQLIMIKLNIPTYFITGTANEGLHSWNLVLLDDDYYNVDVTWDDSKNTIIYDYYNLNDKEISRDHTRDELSSTIFPSYGIKY